MIEFLVLLCLHDLWKFAIDNKIHNCSTPQNSSEVITVLPSDFSMQRRKYYEWTNRSLQNCTHCNSRYFNNGLLLF